MGIGEYFMSVVAASVIASLITLLCGDEKSALGRVLSTVCSLFLLCVIVSPISSIIAKVRDKLDFGDFEAGAYESAEDINDALYTSLAASSQAQIEELLHARVTEKVGIDGDDLEVRAEVEVKEGNVVLERIIVCLYGEARWCDPRAISGAVGELTDAECLIINGE